MAAFNITLTEAGKVLLAKGIAGSGVRFANILMGDGINGEEDPSWKQTLPIIKTTRSGEQVTVRGVLSLADLKETFYWKELGITALDPDSGEETLYAYGSSGMEGDLISHSGTLTEKQIAVVLMIDSGTEVSATADESLIFAQKQELEELSKKAWVNFSCTKSGTKFQLTGSCGSGFVQGIFTAPAAFAKGDSFTVNGTAFTVKQQNGEEADDTLFASGSVVSCIIDTNAKTVNFKSSGGSRKHVIEYTTASAGASYTDTFTLDAVPQMVTVIIDGSYYGVMVEEGETEIWKHARLTVASSVGTMTWSGNTITIVSSSADIRNKSAVLTWV